jgi:hypothetical protein
MRNNYGYMTLGYETLSGKEILLIIIVFVIYVLNYNLVLWDLLYPALFVGIVGFLLMVLLLRSLKKNIKFYP